MGAVTGPLPGMTPSEPKAVRTTLAMIATAACGVFLMIVCLDAMLGALAWATMEIVGIPRPVIGWIEGVLLFASLAPAVWLFRRALDNERTLWSAPAG